MFKCTYALLMTYHCASLCNKIIGMPVLLSQFLFRGILEFLTILSLKSIFSSWTSIHTQENRAWAFQSICSSLISTHTQEKRTCTANLTLYDPNYRFICMEPLESIQSVYSGIRDDTDFTLPAESFGINSKYMAQNFLRSSIDYKMRHDLSNFATTCDIWKSYNIYCWPLPSSMDSPTKGS